MTRSGSGGDDSDASGAAGQSSGGSAQGGSGETADAVGGESDAGSRSGQGGIDETDAPAGGSSAGGGAASGAGGSGSSMGAPGGAGAAGSAGGSNGTFMLGADISSVQEAIDGGAVYVDTDGQEKDLLSLLGNHGFNYVRLRTFVNPGALYGYANPTGEAQYRKAEDYCDVDHTLEHAKLVKQAGMGFLLDLHYSDNWADPGKQIIPSDWRGVGSIGELAAHVKDYTQSAVKTLVDGGARPDMVQIGNEITPGLLMHVPGVDPQPDQWGNISKVVNTVNGSTANWNNVATLLKAGVDGVKAVDPSIEIMLHLENTKSFPAVRDWVRAVQERGVSLDVLGLSCYTAWQGSPAIWQNTFNQLAAALPDISFVIAEYNPERTRANQIMRALPDGRGLGTFFWEPTQSGAWGASLFAVEGTTYTANEDDFAEFDALRPALGLP